jgi:hypothetical protein
MVQKSKKTVFSKNERIHVGAPPLAEHGLTYLDGAGKLWKVVLNGALPN